MANDIFIDIHHLNINAAGKHNIPTVGILIPLQHKYLLNRHKFYLEYKCLLILLRNRIRFYSKIY